MEELGVIGVDLAKNVLQLRSAASDRTVVFRKKMSRPQFARFMALQRPCLVAMGQRDIRRLLVIGATAVIRWRTGWRAASGRC